MSSSRKILWVEDDGHQREIIAELFGLLGYRGEVVGNGQAAIARLAAADFDTLITDIGMPGMNGWQLIEEVRRTFSEPLAIIIISGWADEIDDETRTRLGLAATLSKPFQIAQLRAIIES